MVQRIAKILTQFIFAARVFSVEILSLDVISYESFIQEDPESLSKLERALHDNGIVGIRGVPGYKEMVFRFMETARQFCALPEEVKESYAPNRELGDLFLGYERGKEKFQRPDGTWMIDDLKVSYYAAVPNKDHNKWPKEIDLQTPFQELGYLMSQMGQAVMHKMKLLGKDTGIDLTGVGQLGRMLYYSKGEEASFDNPFWCGAHFDHGLFTVLLPAFYFSQGEAIAEPEEAGLFVRAAKNGTFKKVVSDDPEVMLFQVGEFGQIVSNDEIRATEHRVHKAFGSVERYTMALFFDAPPDLEIRSYSELTQDSRYGGEAGAPCSYRHWNQASFDRYLEKEP